MTEAGVTTQAASEVPGTHETILAALEQTRSDLARAREELQSTVRGLAIDRALMEAGATNIAAARAKLADMAGTEPGAAVAALRAREPGLFAARTRIAPGASTSTPRGAEDGVVVRARAAAGRAATGDRRALLDYMRLRRAAV